MAINVLYGYAMPLAVKCPLLMCAVSVHMKIFFYLAIVVRHCYVDMGGCHKNAYLYCYQ